MALEFVQHLLTKWGHRKLLSVTETTALYASAHPRCCVPRASGLVSNALPTDVTKPFNGAARRHFRIVITQCAAICVVFASRLSGQLAARPTLRWPNSESLRDTPSARREIDDSAAQVRGLPVPG